jgi:hypothetical protein
MTEDAPLLLQPNRPHEHPIFLRVCHSPWKYIDQSILLLFRGLIAAYLTAVFGIVIDYEFNHTNHGVFFFFDIGNIIFAAQIAYYWVSFVSVLHLHEEL